MTPLEALVTILLNNLDQASREAGYFEARLNQQHTRDLEEQRDRLRLYSLHLIGLIRDLTLENLSIEEVNRLGYAYPQ